MAEVRIRGLDREIWKKLRIEALQKGVSANELLLIILHDHVVNGIKKEAK